MPHTQTPTPKQSSNARNIGFLTGVARSGTTAAVSLLNKHPDIALGIERFKFTFLKHDNPDQNMFDRERFFAFDETETNLLPEASEHFATHYQKLEEKFDTALVVGDKIPNLSNRYRSIVDMFPTARIVHMVREPASVASSWERRALNPDDQWLPTADAAKAVERWLSENTAALDFQTEFPDRILLVSYEGLFSRKPQTLARICDFLGVGDPTPFQHKVRLAGANRTAGKKFSDLGAQPSSVDNQEWDLVVDLLAQLQTQVEPTVDAA